MKTVILVPYFIENVLKRNRLNLATALNYEEMKKVVSTDDLNTFLLFQDNSFFNFLGFFSRSVLLSSWEQLNKKDVQTELASVGSPLLNSENQVDAIAELLSIDPHYPQADIPKPYSVVDISRDSLALVVRPGFKEYIESKEGKLQLVRDILNTLYASEEVHKVSSTLLFKTYLSLL